MSQDFDWDLLRSFLAVARSGKLTQAARKLRVDHSTLSRRIATLEGALRLRLFDKSLAGYQLTADGERLLVEAEAMESRALSIGETLPGREARVSGTVRIGAPDGFGSVFLAARIGALQAMHPALDIEIVATPRNFNLTKREADLAIGLSGATHARLYTRKLGDYTLGLYAARDKPALFSGLATPQDLAGRPFVSYIDDLIHAPELDYLPGIGQDIQPRLRSSNLIAQWQATAAGAGLCVLPAFLADPDPRLVRVLPETIGLSRSFWLSVHADMRDLARIRVTADFIAACVAAERRLFLPESSN